MLIDVDDLVTTIEQLVEIEPEVQFVMGGVGTRPSLVAACLRSVLAQ